jgi:hypothetical protein
MFCGRHSVTSLSPHQSDEHLAGSLSLPMSPKRFPHYLPPPGESAQVHIIAESQKDCSSDGGDCSSLSMLPSCEDYVAAEKPVQAYLIDQESSKDFFSPPPSTIGDDFQELESSLLALSVEEERKIGSGQCTSSRRYIDISIPPTEEFRVIKESDFNTHRLPRRKTKPPGKTSGTKGEVCIRLSSECSRRGRIITNSGVLFAAQMQQWHSQIYSQCKGVQLLLQLSMIS